MAAVRENAVTVRIALAVLVLAALPGTDSASGNRQTTAYAGVTDEGLAFTLALRGRDLLKVDVQMPDDACYPNFRKTYRFSIRGERAVDGRFDLRGHLASPASVRYVVRGTVKGLAASGTLALTYGDDPAGCDTVATHWKARGPVAIGVAHTPNLYANGLQDRLDDLVVLEPSALSSHIKTLSISYEASCWDASSFDSPVYADSVEAADSRRVYRDIYLTDGRLQVSQRRKRRRSETTYQLSGRFAGGVLFGTFRYSMEQRDGWRCESGVVRWRVRPGNAVAPPRVRRR